MMCQYFPQGSVIFTSFVVLEATGFYVFKLSNGEGSFPTNTPLFQPSLYLWYSWVALTVIHTHVMFKSAGHQGLVHYFILRQSLARSFGLVLNSQPSHFTT